jgi:hypothetical protein
MNAAPRTGSPMKRWMIAIALAAAMFAAVPSTSRASSSDEDVPTHDARLDGYATKTVLDGGTAVTYICLGLLSVLCLGVLFINGKRTHLD